MLNTPSVTISRMRAFFDSSNLLSKSEIFYVHTLRVPLFFPKIIAQTIKHFKHLDGRGIQAHWIYFLEGGGVYQSSMLFRCYWHIFSKNIWNCGGIQTISSVKYLNLPSIFLCRYLFFWALHNLIPSMMDAWFSSSDNTASFFVNSVSKIPAFASKQLAYKIASSLLWNLAIFSSSSLWIFWNVVYLLFKNCYAVCIFMKGVINFKENLLVKL